MKQKTAVEWLIEKLSNYDQEMLFLYDSEIRQAKEKEEQNYLDLIRFLRTQDKMGKSAEDLLEQFKKK